MSHRSVHLLVGTLFLLCTIGFLPPTATADPGKQAESLRARCRALSGDRATNCYNEALLVLLGREGVSAAMAVLQRLGEMDKSVQKDGHLYAHSIGLAAFRGADQVGATFAQCTPVFQSGCYHGVIQAYFASLIGTTDQGGVGEAAVNALCESYQNDPESRLLLFQCAHGMGHGLTMFYGHHLPRALAGCDLLRDPWQRESCYSGAFMENVVQATVPHHTVGRPQAEGGSQGHGAHHHEHAHGAPAETYKALDPGDPLYPCNTVDERYQRACYEMQTSAILFFNRGDFSATARACASAPEAHRATCYQSLGRDISAYTLQDHKRAMELCSSGDPLYRRWCHVGYAKNLIDLTANAADGLAYCRALPDTEAKNACYAAIGEEIWVLSNDREKQRTWCESAEPEYRTVCMAAAGLTVPSSSP